VVVTDRLHAAVFSVLLGKPVVMVDNANKKLSAIYRDYLGSTPGTYLADDFDDAAQTVESLL
jgi:pyruvyl transferase EpsO